MEEKGDQMLSVRISEDLFIKLKKYSEEQGENISDSVRKAIEKFIYGVNNPVPEPPDDILFLKKEILGIKRNLSDLNSKEEDSRQYIEVMAGKFNEVQLAINNISLVANPFVPLPFPFVFPAPPWAAGVVLGDVQSTSSAVEEGVK